MNKLKSVLHIVGARPNFMKAAPLWSELSKLNSIKQILVHTGQHYDNLMSDIFFKELDMPNPDFNLNIGSDSHAKQTASIMIKLERLLLDKKPDLVIVYGDVNSTVAAAMVCSKIHIPFVHVEAGLRSFDRRMPEEVNRLITDQLADLLFTPSEDGNINLKNEGIAKDKIFLVGNIMIDTLVKLNSLSNIPDKFKLLKDYVLVTLHRPSNVDDTNSLRLIMKNLIEVCKIYPVIFPIHPRTKKILVDNKITFENVKNLHIINPLGYLDFLGLMKKAKVVITDSGGIQEETTWLGVPCLTVRENTERPVTITTGTNQLIGKEYHKIPQKVKSISNVYHKLPQLWDGKTAERITNVIKDYFSL